MSDTPPRQMAVDAIRVFTNKASMRAFLKQFSFEQVQEMLEKFIEVAEQIERETEQERTQEAQKQQRLLEYKEQLEREGISITDLVNQFGSGSPKVKKSPRTKRPPKYEYTKRDGERKTWTGQGRQPLEIKAAIQAGKSLDFFLIDKEQSEHS